MTATAFVHLYGSLRNNAPEPVSLPLEANLEVPLPLLSFIEKVGISPDLVQIAMVNHKPVSPKTLINPGDRVALFPLEYPFFADWKDHKF